MRSAVPQLGPGSTITDDVRASLALPPLPNVAMLRLSEIAERSQTSRGLPDHVPVVIVEPVRSRRVRSAGLRRARSPCRAPHLVSIAQHAAAARADERAGRAAVALRHGASSPLCSPA